MALIATRSFEPSAIGIFFSPANVEHAKSTPKIGRAGPIRFMPGLYGIARRSDTLKMKYPKIKSRKIKAKINRARCRVRRIGRRIRKAEPPVNPHRCVHRRQAVGKHFPIAGGSGFFNQAAHQRFSNSPPSKLRTDVKTFGLARERGKRA